MPGFGALGEFALGEGPFVQTNAIGSQWQTPVRKTGLAVAVIATTFVGFVPPPPAQATVFSQFSQPQPKPNLVQIGWANAPQPAFVQPYVFSAFSQPIAGRTPLADEQPSSTLFEVQPPQPPPFTGFSPFEGIIRAKFNVALYSWRAWQPIFQPVDTHDGVWVKKKRKRGPDPIDLELQEKAQRRAALELAVYGPPASIPKQITPENPVIHRPPDVTELARVMQTMRETEAERLRIKQIRDDEDDLESILKDIL